MTNPFFGQMIVDEGQPAGSFEMAGDMEPIPHNTVLKSVIEEAQWSEYNNESYIEIRWSVLDGEYVNRKVFQKVKVKQLDSKKRDKALRMLFAIDTNAGGGLAKLGGEPTDQDLAINLMNKPMLIKVAVWKIKDDDTGEVKSGNWVNSVAPLSSGQPAQAAKQAAASDEVDF